jgi:hypothetical protein
MENRGMLFICILVYNPCSFMYQKLKIRLGGGKGN